jgi:hypothetical protein
MRAVLLVLAALLPLASAVLSGSFCNDNLNYLALQNLAAGSNNPNYYALTSICTTFVNASSFELRVEGIVKVPGAPSAFPAEATCRGIYAFGGTGAIELAYDPSSFCTGTAVGFCPWVCTQFGGSYGVVFAPNVETPKYLNINPASSQAPVYNWGALSISFPMACNTSSCGSASDIFPPAPIPEGAVRSETCDDSCCMSYCLHVRHGGHDFCYAYCHQD